MPKTLSLFLPLQTPAPASARHKNHHPKPCAVDSITAAGTVSHEKKFDKHSEPLFLVVSRKERHRTKTLLTSEAIGEIGIFDGVLDMLGFESLCE